MVRARAGLELGLGIVIVLCMRCCVMSPHRKAVALVYQGDESTGRSSCSTFVHSCVERFENLEQASISKTLETFLKK